MDTKTTIAWSAPRVVRRVYKIQYQPTETNGDPNIQRVGSSNRLASQRRRMSMKAYDRDTDSDIFALGSAFKDGNCQLDQFLKNWSSNAGFQIQQITRRPSGAPEGGDDDMSTFTQIRGINDPNASFPAMPTMPPIAEGVSDPFFNNQPGPASEMNDNNQPQSPQSFVQPGEIGPFTDTGSSLVQEPAISPSATEKSSPTPDTLFSRKAIKKVKFTLGDNGRSTSVDSTKHELPSISEEPEQPLLGQREDQTGDKTQGEYNIDIPECSSASDEDDVPEQHSSRFRHKFWSPKKRKHDRKGSKGVMEIAKGKMGMTANVVPGEEKRLPAIQQLVLNYNRMLDIQREQFVETLFRAVKLNGVDVVKLLCQLALRKNIKLSSDQMREPESSATVLHVALLYDNSEIVQYLIDIKDRDLIMATYTNEDYNNQTALHVAVANGNQSIVNSLLDGLEKKDKKTLLTTIATGKYFKENHPDGQLCLTAAAWAGHGDMLITLAKQGANFSIKNMDGNTLLHRVIMSSAENPDKLDYQDMMEKTYEAVGEWASRCTYRTRIADQRRLEQTQKQIITFQRLLTLQNNDGLTPLAVSAQNGSNLLSWLINLEKINKIPQTKLGSISWVTYDVTQVTSFANDTYNKFSVLHILAHNSGKLSRHANLDRETEVSFLDIEPIKSLINLKWNIYRKVYIIWCLLHLFYHIAFTYCTYDANSLPEQTAASTDHASDYYFARKQKPKYLYGLFTCLPLLYLILEGVDLFGSYPYSICFMKNQTLLAKIRKRVESEWVITGNGPYRFVNFGYSLFTVVWFGLYIIRSPLQDMALAMALLLGWVFVLFFTRGCRVTSRFSIMIQKMFFRDLMYFLAVYAVILASFSFAVNAVYTTNRTGGIFYHMMNIVTDLDEKSTLDEARHPLFAKALLIFYAIVAVILLLNMLIAMMNTSYETVRITRCNLWKQQQLSILLMLERRLFWCRCLVHRSEQDVWKKDMEDDIRAYLDVTMHAFENT